MTKDEIMYLMQNGFELHEIMQLNAGNGSSAAAAPETIPDPVDPVDTDQRSTEIAEPEVSQEPAEDAMKKINDTFASLEESIKKLSDRIAAQGVAGMTGTAETVESLDEKLAAIGKKLNGG